MDPLLEIARHYNLALIEDACQSVLATYHGRPAGSFGTGVFSFYATKNLTTGEGGMITTNDGEIAERCRMLRSHGMKRRYYHEFLGYNFRMTDIQAAIGLVQLEKLEALTAQRRVNAAYLTQHIYSLETPQNREGYGHVWHQYTVRVNGRRDRDQAAQQLKEAGIDTGVYYPVPVHKQQSMAETAGGAILPVAERLAGQVLSLPVHPQLNAEELEYIVAEVNKL
jgi:dTDP-4-amino-4,6-dideoxygalactose transaminase